MDIKSKNKLFIITWFILLTYGLNALCLLIYHGNEYFGKSYFDTGIFQSELQQFMSDVSISTMSMIPKDKVKAELTVTDQDIEDYRQSLGSQAEQVQRINSEYQGKISNALATDNKEAAHSLTVERDQKIADAKKLFTDNAYVKAKLLKNKEQAVDDYYQWMTTQQQDFSGLKQSFEYYYRNSNTGAVYSNLSKNSSMADINNKNMLYIKNQSIDPTHYLDRDGVVSPILEKMAGNLQGKVGVPKNISPSSELMVNFNAFHSKKTAFYTVIFTGILALLLSLFLYKKFSVLRFFGESKWQALYKRIPIDICLVVLFVTGLITLLNIIDGGSLLYQSLGGFIREVIFKTLFLIATVIQGKWFYSRVKANEDHPWELWEESLTYKFFMELKNAFLDRSVGTQILILLIIVFFTGFGVPIVLINMRYGVGAGGAFLVIYFFLFMIVTFPALVVLTKRIGYFNLITRNVDHLVKGFSEPDLPEKGYSALKRLARNINTLKHGVTISQEKQAKSERLKTELITNVSHDLRTPLTSIITYTELLKTPNLTEDERDTYLEVIDRKSKRLKVLIEDLFEASKMASGAVELEKKKVDILQLMQQTLAENDERIQESTLQFRLVQPDQPVFSIVDGQKMWRVFDNLIGNILKYALENTRVYITVNQVHDQVTITLKNITKYELSENIDELFERFKRGDTSRHTDGSGLGLAIAKSIVDLHGGTLDIEVDGDLFKVTVQLKAA